MSSAEQTNVEEQTPSAVDEQTPKKSRQRQSDDGPQLLPNMEHFVTLVRKAKRPALVLMLVERAAETALPQMSSAIKAAKGALLIPARKTLFDLVAKLTQDQRQTIECAAERVVLLDDEYGAQAVQSLLDEHRTADAAIMSAPTDRHSRALYLYLLQAFPSVGSKVDQRFEHAEHLQVMHRQWKNDDCSSHYFGPKGIEPKMDDNIKAMLQTRIAALYPQVIADQILVELFTRGNGEQTDNTEADAVDEMPASQHTITATFNGSQVHFKQVSDGQVQDHEEPAAMSVNFSWEPSTGALGVFCKDDELRRGLAAIFRDVVLACDGEINDMPMREFDLLEFSTDAILKRMLESRIDGIEKISILQLKIKRPFEQKRSHDALVRDMVQNLASTLLITRDRRDYRDIYQLAYDDYGLDDFTGYLLSQVKLVLQIGKQAHRKAHNVAVQITAPNGLNDKRASQADSKLILEQLARLDIVRQF